MERILVIDDNSRDRKLLRDALAHEGYTVDEAADGADGLKVLFHSRPDVVVLDILMPGMDGWVTCQRIREVTEVPVIMLTSLNRDEEVVKGLELGADDFVSKPVSPRQLIARVRAVLRRARAPATTEDAFTYDDGSLLIDVAQHQVRLESELVELSPTEFRLLVALAEAPGRVHAYSALLSRVWGSEYVDDIDFLRVYIWRLRKKLEKNPDNPTLLLTERGFGYRFARGSS
ncbi:MAG: response regulator transcription factor [Chloroflexi bacterium]|nr:response regulator transcription factor [Chloroflexota bacterium]